MPKGPGSDDPMRMFRDFDPTRFFSGLKIPAMPNLEAFLSAHRRNMETLTAANRVAFEGAQAVARRHLEIMQQGMAEMAETMRSLGDPGTPEAKAAKQAELLRHAYERAVANMRELGEMIQHSNAEAIGLLNQRFAESMEELKSLVKQSKQRR